MFGMVTSVIPKLLHKSAGTLYFSQCIGGSTRKLTW